MPFAIRTALSVFCLLWALCAGAAEKSILVFGDSLSAAHGIAAQRGWVALLGERLARERPDYRVVNASVSGETSAGGRARLDELLERHRPALVIVELGGNDGLRGLPVAQMKANLDAIVVRSQKAGARVLMLGMKIPPNYGADYADAFHAAFEDVAKRHRTALVPFFLEGIAGKQELFQPDGIHPTAEAQPELLERVWRALAPLLK